MAKPATHFGNERGVSLQADCALQVCLGLGSISHVPIGERPKGVCARMPAVELNGTAELCDGAIEVTEIVVGETALEVPRSRIFRWRSTWLRRCARRRLSLQGVVRERVTGVGIGKESRRNLPAGIGPLAAVVIREMKTLARSKCPANSARGVVATQL